MWTIFSRAVAARKSSSVSCRASRAAQFCHTDFHGVGLGSVIVSNVIQSSVKKDPCVAGSED